MANELKKLYIIGAGGFGREVADTVAAINAVKPTFSLEGFIDDTKLQGEQVNGIPVAGDTAWLAEQGKNSVEPLYAVIAIGASKARKDISGRLAGAVKWAKVIHPTAIISPTATIAEGSVIQHHSGVNANASVGRHCSINEHTSIGHDAQVGEFSSIMSHCDITGFCKLGEGVFVGSSVAVTPGVSIGEGVFLCAKAMVARDVPAGVKMLGNPARAVD